MSCKFKRIKNKLVCLRREDCEYYEGATPKEAIDVLIECCELLIADACCECDEDDEEEF